jgi:RNA polymerase sigma-70 factor (ECF subfamily)
MFLVDETAKRQEDWLGKLLAGDHRAFAEFVDKYKEMVFLCCRTLGLGDDEADDVASETFMAAYSNIRRYRGQAELGTWLWRIAYCQGVNYLRKRRRKSQFLAEPDEQIADSKKHEPSATAQGKETGEVVWEAVERLPRLWAVATVLFYREEKSVKEIAKIMRVRQNTVKTYLFRSRKRLKELLAGALGEDIDVGR